MRCETTQLRLTPQRMVILEELRRVKTHPTADEVYAMVRRRLPRISLATVYRNLQIMAACGMVRTVELAGTQKRFDGDVAPHCHVRCVSCGRLGDVMGVETGDLAERFRGATDFEIIGHRLELVGYCSSCRCVKTSRTARSHETETTSENACATGEPTGAGGAV